MDNFKGIMKPKKGNQDLLTDLNNVLTVRAEQIRKRLLDERQDEGKDLEEADKEINQDEIHSPIVSDPALLPVSQARLRRRQKAREKSRILLQVNAQPSKTAPREQNDGQMRRQRGNSTVDIRNYRPGYAWSRGGRVKELRIRCIARKFLFLWQRKVFGRVPLSVAKHHYQTGLMHKAFGQWYDYWWEIVKEWRLGVRAECHYRYKLNLRVFLEWRKFVKQRHARNIKMATALKHYNYHLLLERFTEWKLFIVIKRQQLHLNKQADEFRQSCLMRHAWSVWMKQHEKIVERQENQAVALQFWAYRIQAQHWLVWTSALEERRRQQERCSDAAVYYNSVLVSRCLKAWTLYVKNRRAKKAHSDFAKRVYSASLKLNTFNHWFQHWHLKCSLQQHHLKIETLSQSFRKRWIIWRWSQYVMQQKEKALKELVADKYYSFQLKRLGVDAFRLNVVHSQIKVMRIQLAQQFRITKLQQSAWAQWMTALECREESRLSSQTELARHNFNSNIMRKCFSSLMSYAQWRQQRKRQYAQAEAHYYLHVMPQCLFHMRMFVELEKICRENAAKAQEFCRVNTMERVFLTWQKASVQSRDERLMNRMAFLHRESVILSSTFNLWKQRTLEALTIKDKIAEAKAHYLLSLCIKGWCAWRMYVFWKQKSLVNCKKADHHYYVKMLKKSFCQWNKWTQDKKARKIQMKKAEIHHKHKVLGKCVAEWKVVVLQARQFMSVATVRFQEYSSRLLRTCFIEWRSTAVKLAADRRREFAASVHHNRILIQKALQEWHRYAVIRVYKRSQTNELLREAGDQMNKLKLSLYLKHWREKREVALQIQRSFEQADSHYQQCLQSKVLQAWKSYCRLCLRKKLLARQCEWFHNVRVTAKHFLLWKEQLADHIEEKSKSQTALWQWSLVLQRKVLLAWKSYAELRKHKKARLTDAMDERRQRLLKDACCQWLSTADSLSHLRSVMAAKHQVETAFDSFHLLQRCALHWKVWARKRAAAKGKQTQKEMVLTMTSSVRLNSNPSQFPILSQIYPKRPKEAIPARPLPTKPESALKSPVRPELQIQVASYPDMQHRTRPAPKRPAFLVDSLKRAGLYTGLNDSSEQEGLESAVSEAESTPSISDLRMDVTYPDYPATGRFEPHDHISPPGRRSRQADKAQHHDWSFSAEIMSGSTSSLGPGDGGIKPLHLSSSDTEPSGVHTGSGTSQSPHMYTPSTQRPQFSGNPLLYSSPLSDINAARETWKAGQSRGDSSGLYSGPEPRQNKQTAESKDRNVELVKFGLDMGSGDLLRGNLEGEGWKGMGPTDVVMTQGARKLELWQQQRQQQIDKQTQKQQDSISQHDIVLLKPADFMKKPTLALKQQVGDTVGPRKGVIKHTPRSFAVHETDQTSGLPPMAHSKSGNLESSSNPDSQKENVAPLRHTPREVFSPRRTAPQGILHNKVSDSDGDMSPLNTARSRGTVTFASPKSPSPEEEIINIRDRLRHFSQQKKRLKALSKQYRQLSEWVMEQGASGRTEDEDSQNATEELDMLRLEIAKLQAMVDSQGPICERLVLRAQTLAKELQVPSS